MTKNTTKKKTAKVPSAGTNSAGGVKYDQSKISKGFIAIPPRAGHSQKKNIK